MSSSERHTATEPSVSFQTQPNYCADGGQLWQRPVSDPSRMVLALAMIAFHLTAEDR